MRVASRPRVFPSASTTYQWRSISPGFAFQVFCIEAADPKSAEARFYQPLASLTVVPSRPAKPGSGERLAPLSVLQPTGRVANTVPPACGRSATRQETEGPRQPIKP